MVFKHLDLFSGIGGFSLGLEATGGFETVAFCDIEEFPRKVLQKHWPDVKQYKDIKELTYERLKADGIGPIDIITGGYPCQPFSVAGRKKGEEDPRHLWPEMFRIIKECRPAWVIGENVAGHIKLGLDTVIKDLESEMYSARCFSIPASAVGANHKRERVWIVAYSERNHNFNEKQRVNGEKEEVQRKHREDDSTARQSSGTDSVRETDNGDVVNTDSFRSLQHSETKEETSRRGTETSFMSTSDVEDTRRSLRQGSELREENENEIGKENANQSQRSSEASRSDVADTRSKRLKPSRATGKMGSKSKEEEGRRNQSSFFSTSSSSDVANTDSNREKWNQSQDGKGSGLEQDSSDVADAKSFIRGTGEESKQQKGNTSGECVGNGSPDVADTIEGNVETGRERQRKICKGHQEEGISGDASSGSEAVADTDSKRLQGYWSEYELRESQEKKPFGWECWWDLEPELGRVAHGVPKRVDRLKSLGNSLVPFIPYLIGKSILESE